MGETIHVCVDRILPAADNEIVKAKAELANPLNLVAPTELGAEDSHLSAALDTHKLWEPGRSLRVSFLDGLPEVQEKIVAIAGEWMRYANIEFDFCDALDADIRISFKHPGSWSYIGLDATMIKPPNPTMNYGWLTPQTSDEEYHRVVLHEFGHALGMIHEHQNPANQIPWNRQAVLDFYMGAPNYWSQEQVETNIFQAYAKDHTMFSDFDLLSIMRYPIPREHLLDPNWAAEHNLEWQNSQLSETDKTFIKQAYPDQA